MHFAAFSWRASAGWPTRAILVSSIKTTVRFSLVVSIRCQPNSHHNDHIVAQTKLGHTIGGIYMYVWAHTQRAPMSTNNHVSWETVLSMSFEMDVLRGKRPYRWTIWVGSLAALGHYHGLTWSSYILEHVTQLYLGLSYSLSIATLAELHVR